MQSVWCVCSPARLKGITYLLLLNLMRLPATCSSKEVDADRPGPHNCLVSFVIGIDRTNRPPDKEQPYITSHRVKKEPSTCRSFLCPRDSCVMSQIKPQAPHAVVPFHQRKGTTHINPPTTQRLWFPRCCQQVIGTVWDHRLEFMWSDHFRTSDFPS